jgi:hypothetical protein
VGSASSLPVAGSRRGVDDGNDVADDLASDDGLDTDSENSEGPSNASHGINVMDDDVDLDDVNRDDDDDGDGDGDGDDDDDDEYPDPPNSVAGGLIPVLPRPFPVNPITMLSIDEYDARDFERHKKVVVGILDKVDVYLPEQKKDSHTLVDSLCKEFFMDHISRMQRWLNSVAKDSHPNLCREGTYALFLADMLACKYLRCSHSELNANEFRYYDIATELQTKDFNRVLYLIDGGALRSVLPPNRREEEMRTLTNFLLEITFIAYQRLGADTHSMFEISFVLDDDKLPKTIALSWRNDGKGFRVVAGRASSSKREPLLHILVNNDLGVIVSVIPAMKGVSTTQLVKEMINRTWKTGLTNDPIDLHSADLALDRGYASADLRAFFKSVKANVIQGVKRNNPILKHLGIVSETGSDAVYAASVGEDTVVACRHRNRMYRVVFSSPNTTAGVGDGFCDKVIIKYKGKETTEPIRHVSGTAQEGLIAAWLEHKVLSFPHFLPLLLLFSYITLSHSLSHSHIRKYTPGPRRHRAGEHHNGLVRYQALYFHIDMRRGHLACRSDGLSRRGGRHPRGPWSSKYAEVSPDDRDGPRPHQGDGGPDGATGRGEDGGDKVG